MMPLVACCSSSYVWYHEMGVLTNCGSAGRQSNGDFSLSQRSPAQVFPVESVLAYEVRSVARIMYNWTFFLISHFHCSHVMYFHF